MQIYAIQVKIIEFKFKLFNLPLQFKVIEIATPYRA